MARTLKMVFNLEGTQTVTWNLVDPKDGVQKAEVESFMQEVIDRKALIAKGMTVTGIKDAYIHTTEDAKLA